MVRRAEADTVDRIGQEGGRFLQFEVSRAGVGRLRDREGHWEGRVW